MLVRSGSYGAILCLAAFILGTRAEVEVKAKAYQNVVVSFSQRLSSENATQLVNSLKEVLEGASSVLHEAVGLRIGSVTFQLPRTWKDVSIEGATQKGGHDGKQEHDIHVEALSDSAFGTYPHAVQYGGCGAPGLEISVPDVFLTEEEDYPKGKILAKEWLKYRYGVFDENGFPDDPMYPAHYTVAGSDDIHVTDCTFPKVEYEFRDSEENNCTLSAETESNCFIHPREESAENISSSLMFYHKEIPKVSHVCGTEDHLHNKDSPNKQNLLCFYNSIWDIIKSSADFSDEGADQETGENQDIKFFFAKENAARLVAAWQSTDALQKQGPTVLHAVRKLLHDFSLVDNKVGLYDFKEEGNVREIMPLSELTPESFRNLVLSSVFSKPVDQPCVSCALDKGVEVLLNDSKEEPGTLLIITASNPAEEYLNEKLQNSNLCLIVLGFEGAEEDQWSRVMGNSPCNLFKKIIRTERNEIFEDVYETMERILPEPVNDTKIVTVATGMLTTDTDFVIPANENAARYILWIFETVESESIECKVDDEKVTDLKIESFTLFLTGFSIAPHQEDIKCRLVYSGPVLAQAQMKSEPGAYFNFRSWRHDTTPKNDTVQRPVIIYASLSYGQYPVLNAEVKAVVTHPDGKETELPLLDNGSGDPDVTQNDGIYSRYFTEIDGEGSYGVEVRATTKDQLTKIGKQGQAPCCGSIVINEAFNVSSFDLVSKTDFESISKKPEEGYKPSRVVDLKVEKLELQKSVSLKWTAPGGEMDKGQANLYEFKIFCHHKDCNDDGISPSWMILPKELKAKEFGQEEKATLEFTQNAPEDIVVFISLKAISKGNKPGDSSNLVQVKLSLSETLEETTTPVTIGKKKMESPEAGVIVAYVLIALACLILIGGVVFFVLERKRRHRVPDDLNTPDGFGNDNKAFTFQGPGIQKENAMERAEALPVQLYTHDQIKDIREKQKVSPKQRSGLTPKTWSSLDALSGDAGNVDKNNSDSASITQIDLKKTNVDEIKQLDDVSQKSIPIVVRDSKF